MNLKDTYDKIAEDWHKDHQADEWWVEGTDRFIALLGSNTRVLDIGCGSGVKSKYLKEHGIDVVGIDLSSKMIEIAKREVSGVEFHALDLKEAWRLDGMFDGLFMQAVLLHVPKADARGIIEMLAQKLKPGGFFYIAVKAMREGGVEEEVKAEHDYGYEYARFFSYYTQKELQSYFKDAGFEILHEEMSGGKETPSRWIQMIARKLR